MEISDVPNLDKAKFLTFYTDSPIIGRISVWINLGSVIKHMTARFSEGDCWAITDTDGNVLWLKDEEVV